LTLLALTLLPAFVLPARWVGKRLAAITRESYELNAEAAQTMNERFNVAGAHLVKVFGDPGRESSRFAAQARRVRDIGVKQAMYGTVFRVGLTVVASVAVAIVYGLGGVMAISGTLTVGTVVALTAYLGRLYGPLTAMSNVQVDVMTALVSFERVLEVLDLEPTVTDAPDATDLADAIERRGARRELHGVTFRYPRASAAALAFLRFGAVGGFGPTSGRPRDASLGRPVPARGHAGEPARRSRRGQAGGPPLAGCDRREHPVRQARRDRRRARGRAAPRARVGRRRSLPLRDGHRRRRPRLPDVRRRAPAPRHRPRVPQGAAARRARRGDGAPRLRLRGGRPGRARGGAARSHVARHRAPALDGPRGRPHRRARRGRGRRDRHA